MCGIFGAVYAKDERITPTFVGTVVDRLLCFSESRGNEAAGLLVHNGQKIELVKDAGAVSEFLKNDRFQELRAEAQRAYGRLLNGEPGAGLATLGHSRMVTNGFQSLNDNNQPVIVPGAVGIHNGIIVNDGEIWRRHPDLARRYDVDTEALLALARKYLDQTQDPSAALRSAFQEIFGSASTAILFDDVRGVALATNTGSLFYALNERGTFLAFASERFILHQLLASDGFEAAVGKAEVAQIRAGHGMLVGLGDLAIQPFELGTSANGSPNGKAGHAGPPAPQTPVSAATPQALVSSATPPSPARSERAATRAANGAQAPAISANGAHVEILDRSKTRKHQQRCKRCILPASYPFVDFDADGLCRYCRNWRKIAVKGEEALRKAVEPYRSKDGSPDVIVAFSGGRDSSYGLHYVKKVLGMNPVAFTFDWGLVTDLARRNQARVCGKLGVEHILRSADLTTKRRYARKNVEAWLKKPDPGMVTLFTAGDKEFYHYARQLRKETGIKLVIFCTGNMIEDTPYKTGLCGIREDDHGMTLTGLSFRNEMALLWYYAKNYLRNPAYLNASLWDTLKAYYHTFVAKDDFLYLFHYLEWREEEIVGTIRREYDWEIATDTTTTWRIGDGTAPFYNYIYDTICGFTEDEVMLSNMIREGHLDRDEALRRAEEFGKPRFPSIREYAQLVGFNCEEALRIINAAPKQY